MKQNIVMLDNDLQEASEYLKALIEESGDNWIPKFLKANETQGKLVLNIKRYLKYIYFPFKVFLQRKQYNVIIGWQAFYGVFFAFYCRLFNVKKENKLVIQHFIYKRKKGIVGVIYDKFIHYAVNEKYVDLILTCSRPYVDELIREFDLPTNKVAFVPFGVNDFSLWQNENDLEEKEFIFSVGRSNRDWEFLISALKKQKQKSIICCDTLHVDNLPSHIIVKNDVTGTESFKYMENCKCAVIPIDDGRLSAGETVLLQQMCFGKPIIITRPSSLASGYIDDGINGIVIDKDEDQLLSAITKLYSDNAYCEMLSKNAREDFVRKYSLYSHGVHVIHQLKKHHLI